MKQRIRASGERLNAHRLYIVLERLRAGEPLTAKQKKIHDDLAAAVFEAYSWTDLNGSAGRPILSGLHGS